MIGMYVLLGIMLGLKVMSVARLSSQVQAWGRGEREDVE